MTTTPEVQSQAEQLDPAALAAVAATPEPEAPEADFPIRPSSRKSVVAFAMCALAINGAAAIYTLPSDLQLPDVGSVVAELMSPPKASAPKPDPVIAALKDIQLAQQEHAASLQQNNQSLQQQSALMQQDSMLLLSLRSSITDERVDVKKISSQLNTLIAKIDSLQNSMMSDVTSSIPRSYARSRMFVRKRMVRPAKPIVPGGPVGPVSVGGAPLTVPAVVAGPES